MDDDGRDHISQALHDGLYALLGDPEVTKDEALRSIREAIYLVNDEWGIETGHRPDPELEDPDEVVENEQDNLYPKEFWDANTGSWARITKKALLILGGHDIQRYDPPIRYPLAKIERIKQIHISAGVTAVAAQIPGLEKSPCTRFKNEISASQFADALRTAANIPREE